MNMGKRIHQSEMVMTRQEHERFHREHRDLTPAQHHALTRKLGITKEQHDEWHRTHLMPEGQRDRETQALKAINPFAVGGGFLSWCVNQGWLVQRGTQYFATPDGARKLRQRFDIDLQLPA
jgi:hypothetical protein